MKSYLSKRGYVIEKDSMSCDEINKLRKELVAKPLVDDKYAQAQTNTDFNVYIETKTKLYIPKMYGIKTFGLPQNIRLNYYGKTWKDIYDNERFKFNGTLLERQIDPVDKLLKACKEKYGGILNCATGGGKTFMLLYVLSQLKGKAIIIVNKIALMKQWEDEINQFLPNVSVGILQGQKNVDTTKDITIAMLQSLSRIDYPDELFNDMNITVVDEVHNISTANFSKILFKLCSQYTIGLSATPKRADGCEYVFYWHLGDLVLKQEITKMQQKGLSPIIRALKIESNDYKQVSITNRYTGQETIQFTTMLTELLDMPKRNKLIVEIIKEMATKEKRRILVLTDRRNHVMDLKALLDQDLSVTFTYGIFIGSMKISDLNLSKSCDVILATTKAFGEGVSEKDLDTLVLVTPKKFVGHLKTSVKNESGRLEQIIGRIFRKTHVEKNPVIIDFQDFFSVYKHQAAGRNVFYKQHFASAIFEQQYINLDNHDIDKINMSCIETKKTKHALDPEIKKREQDTNKEHILNFCMLE